MSKNSSILTDLKLNKDEENLLRKAKEIIRWNKEHPDEPQKGLDFSDFTEKDKLRK